MRAAWLGALGISAAAAATVGWMLSCSDNSCQGASCANPDSGGAPSISGGGCDSSKPPAQGGCAVADADGFFVSPGGSDGADGSKATPFKTIAKGISAAAAAPAKPNVYVCAGTFAENLTIQSAPQGVALHGGFSCADWSPGGGTTAVAPASPPAGSSPQYALRVLGTAALVESMTLTAPDATDPGGSSIAAFVDTSPGMTFRRATVTAGKAADGVSPAPVAQLAANTAGNNASNLVPGAPQKCNCATDFSLGGGGGYVDGGSMISPQPGLPVINGVDAGAVTQCVGGNGADGIGQGPANSTNVLGEVTSNGWTPAPGGPGATGGTAQGGAGGNWSPGNGFGGSSGGCGGCGGNGGAGGGGGGGSIAVAVLNTTLRIQASTLHGGTAGNGGNGASGQIGQPGGAGGTTNCAGGAGGKGGNGGAAGGGAGGVSLGIAAFNTTPDIDSQSSVLGGKAGTGGNNGASPPTSKAIDGVAEAFHTF